MLQRPTVSADGGHAISQQRDYCFQVGTLRVAATRDSPIQERDDDLLGQVPAARHRSAPLLHWREHLYQAAAEMAIGRLLAQPPPELVQGDLVSGVVQKALQRTALDAACRRTFSQQVDERLEICGTGPIAATGDNLVQEDGDDVIG